MSKHEWKKLSKNEWRKWVGVVGRILLAYALVFVQGAWATQNQATKDKAASPQKAVAQQANEKQPSVATSAKGQTAQTQGEESETVAEQKPSRDGSHEGIKVHGHWTIEVKNPDGTVVTHREFENSYTPAGLILSRVLARSLSPGLWGVVLTTDGICQNGGPSKFCIVQEAGWPVGGATYPNLTITPPGNAGPDQITLSGFFPATYAGNIQSVQSLNATCSNTIAPSNPCVASGVGYTGVAGLTNATLAQPVPVAAGQTVAITVVISFS